MSEKLASDLESALRGFADRGGTPREAANLIRATQKLLREEKQKKRDEEKEQEHEHRQLQYEEWLANEKKRKEALRQKHQAVLDLRREGMIYRKIGERVGMSASFASTIVRREEARLAEQAEQEARDQAKRKLQERGWEISKIDREAKLRAILKSRARERGLIP